MSRGLQRSGKALSSDQEWTNDPGVHAGNITGQERGSLGCEQPRLSKACAGLLESLPDQGRITIGLSIVENRFFSAEGGLPVPRPGSAAVSFHRMMR
jgi:hypothetical protein